MRGSIHQARHRRPRRGFALLIVMMLVAFVGVGAAALLDLVNIDIGIAAEYNKSVRAEAASVGAVLETIGDPTFDMLLPEPDSPNLRAVVVDREGPGSFVVDPANLVSRRALTDADSAFIENPGGHNEDGYESDVQLLRLIPRQNSSYRFAVAVYEVRAVASVSGGQAAREARALIYRPVAARTDQIIRQTHAR